MSLPLSEHMPLIASAPDGIQKLRSLILELAALGKLHHNGPNCKDEDWKIGLFSDFFTLEYGDNLPAPKRSGTGEYPVYGSNGVVGTHSECRVTAPCIVVGRKGSAGALNCCRESGCWVTDVAYYCVPPASIDLDFTLTLFQTLGLDQLGKGIKPGLSRSEAYSLSVAIPPTNEQLCIVAKVDELMALCDRLESEQNDSSAAHTQLVETLLGTLIQSTDTGDFEANWQRIAEHFDTLFTTEASINSLQKTILQLAVMGKLVPQDSNDEPARELLKRIADKVAGFTATASKKSKKEPSDVCASGSFELPAGWVWTTIESISHVGTGTTPSRTNPAYFTPPLIPWVTSGETRDSYIDATAEMVSPLSLEETNLTIYPVGTLIVAMYGQGKTRGQVSELAIEAATNQACAAIVPVLPNVEMRKYIKLFFKKIYDEIREDAAGGAQPNLNVGKIKARLISLPPLSEQRRIVAKVDELMALCDALKSQLAESRKQEGCLADTLIQASLKAA